MFTSFNEGFLFAKFHHSINIIGDFPGGSVVKSPPAKSGDVGSIPGLERSPGERNGHPCQYSCLEKPMDRGPWWAITH